MKTNLDPSTLATGGPPKSGVLAKVFTLSMIAALTAACGGGSSSSAPPASTAEEEITSTKVETTEVTAAVRVPSATTVKTVADNGISFGVDDFLYALKGLVPEALALEESDLIQVAGSDIRILDIDLLRFTKGSGYEEFTITDSQKNNAFDKDSEGNLTIDLEALAAAGVETAAGVNIEAALDTALVMQVKITVVVDGADVEITMRSPLVNESLDVSPVSEFIARVIGSDVEADLSNLNITEVRNLLSDAFEVSVAGSGSVENPDDLTAGLEETAGAQIEEQFEGYQEEEPVDDTIAAANGTFNLLVFEQSLFAATDSTSGEESHLAGRASITVEFDSGGNGTARFNGDAPSFLEGDAELDFDGSGFSFLDSESSTTGESDTGSAEIHANGNVLLTFPGLTEFDDEEPDFPFWVVDDAFKLTLRSMGLAAGGQGRIGVGLGVQNEFGDDGGAPNFDDHQAHGNFTPLVLTLPQSSLSASDFTRDMGIVFIDRSLESTGSNTFRIAYEVGDELITATPDVPEHFAGGTTTFFEIVRNEVGTLHFFGSEANTDKLTLGNFSNGTFDITSTLDTGETESAGLGIAAPGGELMGAIILEVDCRDDVTGDERSDSDTLNCQEGETVVDAETGIILGVPVAETPSLQQGDQYRFVVYELDTVGGVETCRGDLEVAATATTQDLTLSNQKCTTVDRTAEADTSVSAISTFSPVDETLSFAFNGRVLEKVDNTDVRGFVSDDKNTIVLRFADAADPNFVGIVIASRVVDSSTL